MIKKVNNVIYFAAVMYNTDFIESPGSILSEVFKIGDIICEEFTFDHTKYYEPEMGAELKKYFIMLEDSKNPALLSDFKLKSIELESLYARNGNRLINIDPGYVAIEKVVVASTKNFTHRIYLKDGIYGDIQLMRQKKVYSPMPWTYADYNREESIKFFNMLSDLLPRNP